jgi:ankyrin repeat protein
MDMSDPISQRQWVVDPVARGTAHSMEFDERTIGINKPGHGRMVKKKKYRDRLTVALLEECGFAEQRCSIIEELLTWGPGADVQACTDDQRCTPLYIACSRNNLTTAELLLKHRANPDVTGPKGPRPIEMAALGGHAEMIELLFAYGADAEATPSADVWLQRSDTMLNLLIKHALMEQHAECVELLRK